MSFSISAPLIFYSSKVYLPPDKACLMILFFIYSALSSRKTAVLSIEELILVLKPYKAGINFEQIRAGLKYFNHGAMSLVILKNGS